MADTNERAAVQAEIASDLQDDVRAALPAAYDGVPAGWMPEHWHNPFIRVLGAPPTLDDKFDILERKPLHSDAERRLSHDERMYALLRMFGIVSPLPAHLDVVNKVHMLLRLGYEARDPAKGLHRRAFLASAAVIEGLAAGELTRDDPAATVRVPNAKAAGFALLGDVGMGKSTIVDLILGSIRQVVEPDTPYYVKQVTWLKVECPPQGGRKQLCDHIFAAFDEVLGTRYQERFGTLKRNRTGDQMMDSVRHLVSLHAVGMLVLDELQHSMASPEGVDPMMNFLVGLVNMLSVPVLVIGTNAARPIVEGSFRMARRAAGLGQPNWFRLKPGSDWDLWLADVWACQWTATRTELDDDISQVLYDESQGILDIAVKLILVTQLRLITRGQIYDEPEVITPDVIRLVAKEEFSSVQVMIKALRGGNDEVLATIRDLEPLHAHIEKLFCRGTGSTLKEIRTLRELRERTAEAEKRLKSATSHDHLFVANLLQKGYPQDVAERVVAEAASKHAADDFLGITQSINDLLTAEKEPKRRKSSSPTRAATKDAEMVAATAGAENAYAALKEKGIIKDIDELKAA